MSICHSTIIGVEAAPFEVRVHPGDVYQVGEDIDLDLYVSRAIDNGSLTFTGPYTISDKIESLPAETYAYYLLKVAEQKDVGIWQVTFQGCYYESGEAHCNSASATFEVVSSYSSTATSTAITNAYRSGAFYTESWSVASSSISYTTPNLERGSMNGFWIILIVVVTIAGVGAAHVASRKRKTAPKKQTVQPPPTLPEEP